MELTSLPVDADNKQFMQIALPWNQSPSLRSDELTFFDLHMESFWDNVDRMLPLSCLPLLSQNRFGPQRSGTLFLIRY
jgi:hypothetical protein